MQLGSWMIPAEVSMSGEHSSPLRVPVEKQQQQAEVYLVRGPHILLKPDFKSPIHFGAKQK